MAFLRSLPRHRRSKAQERVVEAIQRKSDVSVPRHRRDSAHECFVAAIQQKSDVSVPRHGRDIVYICIVAFISYSYQAPIDSGNRKSHYIIGQIRQNRYTLDEIQPGIARGVFYFVHIQQYMRLLVPKMTEKRPRCHTPNTFLATTQT